MSATRLHLLSILIATTAFAALNGHLQASVESLAGAGSSLKAAMTRAKPQPKSVPAQADASRAVNAAQAKGAGAADVTFALR
jgi:hypothetical protein